MGKVMEELLTKELNAAHATISNVEAAIEAQAKRAKDDIDRATEIIRGLVSGDLDPARVVVTDDGCDVMPAMALPTPDNGHGKAESIAPKAEAVA